MDFFNFRQDAGLPVQLNAVVQRFDPIANVHAQAVVARFFDKQSLAALD